MPDSGDDDIISGNLLYFSPGVKIIRENVLQRELGLLDVFMITTGSMIAAGLFVVPGIAFARSGPSVVLSYGIAALIALPTVLSAAELSTAMPKAGGVYFFVSRAVGYGAGSIAGFARWLSIGLKSAYALLGFGFYTYVFTGLEPKVIAVILSLLFIMINLIGIKMVGRTQVIFTAFLVGVLTFLAIGSLSSVNIDNFSPLYPYGVGPVLSTAGFIFISYGGMLAITGLAEEVKRPRRNLPLGMILSLIFTGFVYMLVVFVIVGNLEAAILVSTLTPVADMAALNFGSAGLLLATAGALLAFITTANAGIASASRYPLAMSRDRLLPAGIQKTMFQSKMPYISIAITGAAMVISIIFIELERLVEIASSLLMITYILTNIALIYLRRQDNCNYRPTFRTPLFPWLQILSIAGLVLLLAQIGTTPLLISIIFSIAAYAWYLVRAKQLLDNTIPLPPKPKR